MHCSNSLTPIDVCGTSKWVRSYADDVPVDNELEKSEQDVKKQPKWMFDTTDLIQNDFCYTGWYYNGYCYQFIPKKRIWVNAEMYCKAVAPGGHLASIHTEKENEFIGRVIHEKLQTNPETWIGLNQIYKWGHWMWTDGSVVDFTRWYTGRPHMNQTLLKRCAHFNFG
ncbi:snaclec macrovipecetin subunit beta-like [Rhincodon typus]|uniref:snaclec macrovipecetin subunit beta-like n=1 Tax=Rhincodon typus TaxID=259920 RepID=UPI002030F2AD|nr:snaclec macrovipecetin subunit beta-like [Rhincodon typus]